MTALAPECEIDDCAATVAPLVSDRLPEWLDEGVDSGGERLVEMRRRLVAYFDRRHRPAARALADETFRRIRDGLELGVVLPGTSPAHCCFAVAKQVLLDDVARERTPNRTSDTWLFGDALTVPGAESDERMDVHANQHAVVGRFLDALPPAARHMMLEYYRDPGSAGRRSMAARMNMTPTELGLRASRLRDSVASVAAAGRTAGR